MSRKYIKSIKQACNIGQYAGIIMIVIIDVYNIALIVRF
jgi:hypothetical protein